MNISTSLLSQITVALYFFTQRILQDVALDFTEFLLQAERDRLKSLNSEMVKDHEIELRTKLEDLNNSLEASWLEKLK